MPKKRWLIVVGITVILAVALAILWSPSEPKYHGKPLRYWLQAFDPNYRGKWPAHWLSATATDDVPTRDEAEIAIRAMGTNALPSLLQMIKSRPNRLGMQLSLLARKLPFLRLHSADRSSPSFKALMAFKTLGTNASLAVPQLIEICDRESDRNARNSAFMALGEIGPPAEPAIPVLLRTISDTNAPLRDSAVLALGEIHSDAAEVVPALISCLSDPDPQIRVVSVFALENFGEDAKQPVRHCSSWPATQSVRVHLTH